MATTSVAKAKAAFLEGPKPSTGEWVTDLTFDQTSTLIGKAFAGTETQKGEPLCDWFNSDVTFPNREARDKTLGFLLSPPIYETMQKNGVTFAKKSEDGEIVSVMLMREADNHKEDTWWTKTTDKLRELYLNMKLSLTGAIPEFATSKEYKADFDALQKQSGPVFESLGLGHHEFGPKQSHWYVAFVATDPARQGQGLGSEIMRRVGELADAEQKECFLECGSDSNKTFYEKFGYKVVGEYSFENKLKPDGQKGIMYCMIRPPRSSSE